MMSNHSSCCSVSLRKKSHSEETLTGWWFGTWLLFFHILGRIIPTDEIIFSRGVGLNHQPVDFTLSLRWNLHASVTWKPSRLRNWPFSNRGKVGHGRKRGPGGWYWLSTWKISTVQIRIDSSKMQSNPFTFTTCWWVKFIFIILKWRFPKMGLPPNHPKLNQFSTETSGDLGILNKETQKSPYWNLHIPSIPFILILKSPLWLVKRWFTMVSTMVSTCRNHGFTSHFGQFRSGRGPGVLGFGPAPSQRPRVLALSGGHAEHFAERWPGLAAAARRWGWWLLSSMPQMGGWST
jgi:hypothetical protein